MRDSSSKQQQQQQQQQLQQQPSIIESSRFYVLPTALTKTAAPVELTTNGKDADSSSVSADETIRTQKKSFDTASISTVSTIRSQRNVVTVADVHKYIDNKNMDGMEFNEQQDFGLNPPIIDISFADMRRQSNDNLNDDKSSIMSEDGTTENYSDEERQNSIMSIPSSVNRSGSNHK